MFRRTTASDDARLPAPQRNPVARQRQSGMALIKHRSRLVYEATIVPGLPVPSLLALPAMRSMVSSQFSALIQEMLRRAENT
jgi:hypothetical protein